jgi:hypothetical protein
LRSKTAEEIAWVLLLVFSDFGAPRVLQSDNDPSFLNKIMETMKSFAGFKQRGVMKYFPKANGLPERYIGEVKRLLNKLLCGDEAAWVQYVPAVQIALNDRVISSHKSRPFAVLHARKMNGFEDFRNTELGEPDIEALIKKNEEMVRCVFPKIAESQIKRGDKICKAANEKNVRGKREVPFQIGDTVMKMVDVRSSKTQQRFEGPFRVVEYNPASKGYQILDTTGVLLKGEVPAEHMKIVEHVEERDFENYWEVVEILGHCGPVGDREYEVRWSDKSTSWVHELDFDAFDLIKDYWKKLKVEAQARMQSQESESEVVAMERGGDARMPEQAPSASGSKKATRFGRSVKKPVRLGN